MTCRDDILDAIHELLRNRDDQTFTAPEVVAVLLARKAPYKELTIRSQVAGLMCATQPDPDRKRYRDLDRVGRGRYRLRQEAHDAPAGK